MCDPVTAIAVAAAAATAGTTIYGGVQQRNAAKATARQLETQAGQTAQTNLIQENRQRNESDALLASNRATFASFGTDINSGTPLFLLALSAGRAAYDNDLMKLSGIRNVNTLNNQAYQTRKAGNNALTGAILSAGAQALQSGASIAGGGGKGGGQGNKPTQTNSGYGGSQYAGDGFGVQGFGYGSGKK